jgi:hypothetical protein
MPNDYTKHADPPPSGSGTTIDAELTDLARIEARFWDQVGKLERSALPLPVKEHLRADLEAKRKLAREPHVVRLAKLHDEAMMRRMFSPKTQH